MTSFEFSVRPAGGSTGGTLTSGSAYFTPEMLAVLRSLNPGDRVFLDQIQCKGPDGGIRNLGTMTFVVK